MYIIFLSLIQYSLLLAKNNRLAHSVSSLAVPDIRPFIAVMFTVSGSIPFMQRRCFDTDHQYTHWES